MPDREGFPPGVPAWIDLAQDDPDAAAHFYAGVFGWRIEGDGAYRVASLAGRRVAGIRAADSTTPSATWTTYIATDDADAAAERIRDHGGSVLAAPDPLGDLARTAIGADPSGAVYGLWQPGTLKGAEAVNAPGTWNFSELKTADPETARTFYAAVFGWEVDEVYMGPMSGLMVRKPGYADFLEQFDPGIRKRHADFGAPPGFSECVAWFLPLDDGETSPHWNITFAVADTDAVVDAVRSHGGRVDVEPFDVPPVRSAVVRDPSGARMTVSAFSPG